jgi:hydrogenase maturation protease
VTTPTIYVLGLGNVLMGDDGVGPAVVRAFEAEYIVPPDVEVVDLGTPGLDLSPWLADADCVVIVDTVRSDLPPGTLRLFKKADLLQHAPQARVSPHDPGLKESLLTLEFAGRAPLDVALVGIVPGPTEMGIELSERVRTAIPAAVQAVVAALERFGVDVKERLNPLGQQAWWMSKEASSRALIVDKSRI